MAAIAGIMGDSISHQVMDRMMQKISHRGNDANDIIEHEGILVRAGSHAIEKTFSTLSPGISAVWGGMPPSDLDSKTLAHWPSPFVVAGMVGGDLFLGRDPLGVKPLYFSEADDAFYFASEVKALLQATSDVREFPPGHIFTAQQGFQNFASIQTGSLPYDDPDIIVAELKSRLERAIDRCLVADTVGVWLSGGVDSSVIATLLKQRAGRVISFVIGLPGAPDIDYGGQVAKALGIEHHAYTITLNDVLKALPTAIYALESFDALLVRSSVTHYMISKIAADSVKLIFTGEGGDELFAGYDYMKDYSLEQLPTVLEQAVGSLHNTAFQRVDRCAGANGLLPCFPFADMEVVRYALRIPMKYKLYQQTDRRIEKWILRRVAEDSLPDHILWRPKTKFWQGTGLKELLSRHAETQITDHDFKLERLLPNGWVLKSKEELMYYRIFKQFFGDLSSLEWMGRTQIPSARADG